MSRMFCITVDTEPDCDVRWRRSRPLTFDSVLIGIPQILRPIWNTLGVRPVYFVSTEVVQNDSCCDVLKSEMQLGAEIGAHLHSEYIGPKQKYDDAAGTASDEFPCSAYSTEVEAAKIAALTELIEKRFGVRPVSYRAARYGADLDTIRSLQVLGYRVDSSVTPEIDWRPMGGPDHSKAPKQPYFVSANDFYSEGDCGLLEVPITISGKRFPFGGRKWFFYRWLRPTFMTVFEMKRLVNEFAGRYERPVLNMMFHSMEVLPDRTPFVRTRMGQKMYIKRLERIIGYMNTLGFESRTLKQICEEQNRRSAAG